MRLYFNPITQDFDVINDWIEFVKLSANPGGNADQTLYQDDGTNYDDGTLVWSNYLNLKGSTRDNLMYVDYANNGIVFNGTNSTFERDGTTIMAAALAIKPDLANWNAAGYGMYSTEALRTTDFSIFKYGGTSASPAALTTSDNISNMRFEGADSDATLQVAASFRASVYDTVSSGVVSGELSSLVADNLGNLKAMQTWNYEHIDFLPLSDIRIAAGGGLLVNRNQNNVELRVFTQNDNNAIRVRSNGFSAGEDSIGFFVGTPNSRIGLAGSQGVSITEVSTATYTATVSDYILHVTRTSTGTCAISLPPAADCYQAGAGVGRVYHIVDGAGGAHTYPITITPDGSETINDDSSAAIETDRNALSIYTDGSNWFIF